MVEQDSVLELDSKFPLCKAQAWNWVILWGFIYKGIRDSDSKYRVSRSKNRLSLGLSLVILEVTRFGLVLGIVEASCKGSMLFDSNCRICRFQSIRENHQVKYLGIEIRKSPV